MNSSSPTITFLPDTRDYVVYSDAGELIGFARTPVDAEVMRSDYRYRQLCASGVSALDCADLRAAFQRNKVEAAALLCRLTVPQLVAQAWAYAAYLSELRGEAIEAAQVLTNWERGLARYGVRVG